MNRKWMFGLLIVGGIFCLAHSAAEAAPPWGNLISLKGVDANPDKAYTLNEENGPWMIMACTFSGEGAEKQAKELAYELRKRYKLPAYTHNAKFDPGEAQGRGKVDKYGQPLKFNYWKYKDEKDKEKARHPEISEVAVMVGNFATADDSDAQSALQKLKYATPNCLEVKEGKATSQTLTGWRMTQKEAYEFFGLEKKKLGPMRHAFITTNPLLPADYFAPKNGLDPFLIEMNKNVEHSLLNCPGKYTVQVATFKGQVVIKQDEIQQIKNGEKEMASGLAEAADKAHRLTEALRIDGYEAYEFHDRYASIVTVGSFDSVGTPRADGRSEINQYILKIMQHFGATTNKAPGVQNALKATGLDEQTIANATPVQHLIGIPFDIQPIPIEVPKRSISMALRNRE